MPSSSWRSAAINIYNQCIGILPSLTLTTGVLIHQEIDSTLAFFTIPLPQKRELRHIIVPLRGRINFDVYVLGTNHCTLRSTNDVKKLLQLVKPNLIFVELCRDREEMLHDETYSSSEYYAAAEYRRGEQQSQSQSDDKTTQKMPFMIMGDRPYHVSDQRWWEGLETLSYRIITYLLWPFILPLRDRLWGRTILIDERDTFMAYEIHKCCGYYIDEQQQQQQQTEVVGVREKDLTNNNNTEGDMKSTCTRLTELRRKQNSSLTLNDYFQAMCLDNIPSFNKELANNDNNESKLQLQRPSIVAIIGSNHLDGVCQLLENERIWSPEILLDVVYTARYPKAHIYTQGIVHNVEEYDRNVRVREHSSSQI